MSAGGFVLSRYEMNNGTVVPIQVQPETVALTNGTVANAATANPVTLSVRAKARKGNREYGIGARNISITFNGALPDGYKAGEILTVPILTEAAWNAYQPGGTVTYLGETATIISQKSEQLR